MTDDERKPKGDNELEEDADRAAILARRQRFIAVALSGLAAGMACEGKPKPCLNIAAPEGDPHPCLKVAPPAETDGGETEATPKPCLKVAAPHEPTGESKDDAKDETKAEGDTKDAKDAKEADGKAEAKAGETKSTPRPCLKVARPRKGE